MSEPAELSLTWERLEEARGRLHQRDLSEGDFPVLINLVVFAQELMVQAAEREITLSRLKQRLFGPRTEKKAGARDASALSPPKDITAGLSSSPSRAERKGHGRLPAQAYESAQVCLCGHPNLKAGDRCPQCGRGTLRRRPPAIEIRITGQPPLGATRWELDRLRCDTCGIVVTAPLPSEAGTQKYSAEAVSMIGLLKYGSGVPFFRLARLQERLGVPLPEATQYELLREAAAVLQPVVEELRRQAADAGFLFVDDSPMPILAPPGPSQRQASQTTVIVARRGQHWIYLYQTGREHAGENLQRLLQGRSPDLPAPVQMSDAAACNAAHPFQTLLTFCLTHARRYFFEIHHHFPEVCGRVLETFGTIYHLESRCRELSPQARLDQHRTHSLPRLEQLRDWLSEQVEARRIEPNSSLGKAVGYFTRHWEPLTGFCRIPGAALDNSVSERALKVPILNRKNAYFFKTPRGAAVGDVWMSLIQTASAAGLNPFHYLTGLQKQACRVALSPRDFLPWKIGAQARAPVPAAATREPARSGAGLRSRAGSPADGPPGRPPPSGSPPATI
jgi:transposase